MKEQLLKVEVKVISTETIKPSCPTPSNHKSFTLSSLDQAFPPIHSSVVLLYPNRNNEKNSNASHANQPPLDNILTTLKTSLAETLSRFYPLAGRFLDEHNISCNDQGIPFIHANVDCRLTDVLTSPEKLRLLVSLLPSRKDYMSYGNLPITEVLQLVIQINVFECGGIVIGCYFFHKLFDAVSMSTFLNYWAALASKRNDDLVEPDFDATILAFPPQTVTKTIPLNTTASGRLDFKRVNVLGKSFIFNNAAINKLKIMASNEELSNPTSFEAVAGFLWQQALAAANTAARMQLPQEGEENEKQEEEQASRTVLSFTANFRSKTSPPFPKQTIGNLFTRVYVRPNKWAGVQYLATEIHKMVVSEVKRKVDIMISTKENNMELEVAEAQDGHYKVNSWCKLGLSEVDFGFGKPTNIVPVGIVGPMLRNWIMLVDYIDVSGDVGIEAWLFLEEKEMQILESNSQFLDHASPT